MDVRSAWYEDHEQKNQG